MARLSKKDWLEEGFRLLSQFAQDKLRIAYLCDRLKVTRGSFYHHFNSMEDYVAALLEEWEKGHTTELIQVSSRAESGMEKMEVLNELVFRADQSIEAAIRSWSFYHPKVRQHLQKVDNLRLSYLQELFQQMGQSPDDALALAKLEYATLIGIQQLFPDIQAKGLQHLFEFHQKRLKASE